MDQLDGGGLFANKDVESMKFDEPYQPSPKTISVCLSMLYIYDALLDLAPFAILKNVENNHGGVLQKHATLLKVTLIHGCFSRFLICTNDTQLH